MREMSIKQQQRLPAPQTGATSCGVIKQQELTRRRDTGGSSSSSSSSTDSSTAAPTRGAAVQPPSRLPAARKAMTAPPTSKAKNMRRACCFSETTLLKPDDEKLKERRQETAPPSPAETKSERRASLLTNSKTKTVIRRKPEGLHAITPLKLKFKLGEGPARFAPKKRELHISKQMSKLKPVQAASVERLGRKWMEKVKAASDDATTTDVNKANQIALRFARNAKTPFNEKETLRVLSRFDTRYFTHLGIDEVQEFILSKTILPLPGVKTRDYDWCDVLYIKPSRHVPSKQPTQHLIDNLVYCMNHMMEREKCCKRGIAVIANMHGWTKKQNYDADCMYQLLQALQGRTVPVHVNLCLIVNAPDGFTKIYNNTLKGMLLPSFQRRVKNLSHEDDLLNYLSPGYSYKLPSDLLTTGKIKAEKLAHDFVVYRRYIELGEIPVAPISKKSSSSFLPPPKKKQMPTRVRSNDELATTTSKSEHVKRIFRRAVSDDNAANNNNKTVESVLYSFDDDDSDSDDDSSAASLSDELSTAKSTRSSRSSTVKSVTSVQRTASKRRLSLPTSGSSSSKSSLPPESSSSSSSNNWLLHSIRRTSFSAAAAAS